MSQNRRRNKLVKPGLQLKICAAFLAVSTSCILVFYALTQIALREASLTYLGDPQSIVAHLHGELWRAVAISLLILVPLTLAVGVWITFKLCGPLHRLEHHLEALAEGRDPGPMFFRKTDELQELPGLVNRAIDRLNGEEVGRVEEPETVPH